MHLSTFVVNSTIMTAVDTSTKALLPNSCIEFIISTTIVTKRTEMLNTTTAISNTSSFVTSIFTTPMINKSNSTGLSGMTSSVTPMLNASLIPTSATSLMSSSVTDDSIVNSDSSTLGVTLPTSANGSNNGSDSSVGIIVGCVIGIILCAALMFLVIILVCYCSKRKKEKFVVAKGTHISMAMSNSLNEATFEENSGIECHASYEDTYTKLKKNDDEVNFILSVV